MAAGEYVSVSSQTDAKQADIAREAKELRETPEAELEELTQIYRARGLDKAIARQVAVQLTERDALGAHSRDLLGIVRDGIRASYTGSVGLGGDLRCRGCLAVPLILGWFAPTTQIAPIVALTTLVALAVLGGLGASAGGAGVVKGALRVTFGGTLAMAATAAVGMAFGVATWSCSAARVRRRVLLGPYLQTRAISL